MSGRAACSLPAPGAEPETGAQPMPLSRYLVRLLLIGATVVLPGCLVVTCGP